MASRSADFNYKVALASGLKSLQGGRLRQAEEQFRYLVQHFPSADGGYRGLAKVLVEQEDRPAALRVLLDGGAALAKAGERTAAITLYKESVAFDSQDLTAHRRLAAALTLAGETDEAAREYVRYITSAIAAGDGERAKLVSAYALERLPGNGEILEAARGAGADTAAPPQTERTSLSSDDRDALMRSAFGGALPAPEPSLPAQSWAASAPGSWESPVPSQSHAWQTAAPAASDAWQTAAPAGTDAWAATEQRAAPAPDGEAAPSDADAVTVEATAARFLAKRDPRGGQHALEAARRHIAEGRLHAASDLLLQLIAAGIVDHEAQRLLVDVTMSLGRKDVAKAKVQLLVEALRLDGRAERAAEVEQLAQAL